MIEKLLEQNESKTLEFKENAKSIGGIIKAIVAFANTAGGTIIIGVEDKTKKVVGVKNALDEQERLINAIADSIAPFFIPNLEIQTYRKKELILIHVPYVVGPHYIKSAGPENGVYVRFGPTNRLADRETIATLRSLATNVYFDETPYLHAEVAELDWEYIKLLFKTHKTISENKAEILEIIKRYGGKYYPTNGGVILFGRNRTRIFPHAEIRCVRFAGTSKATPFDHVDIQTYLPRALDEILHFITKNTITQAKIGRTIRTDIPQYPVIAIREAVINALVHTDYTMTGTSITVFIFDDRIEITNPGTIPYGITLAEAIAGSSRIRNRVIAKTFRELKLIEQWGSGLSRIIEACHDAGLKKPSFEELTSQFKVTLYAAAQQAARLKEWQSEFVSHLKHKGKISTKEAAHFWNIDPRNARIKLKGLVEQGIITKIGTAPKDPQSRYTLVSDTNVNTRR